MQQVQKVVVHQKNRKRVGWVFSFPCQFFSSKQQKTVNHDQFDQRVGRWCRVDWASAPELKNGPGAAWMRQYTGGWWGGLVNVHEGNNEC